MDSNSCAEKYNNSSHTTIPIILTFICDKGTVQFTVSHQIMFMTMSKYLNFSDEFGFGLSPMLLGALLWDVSVPEGKEQLFQASQPFLLLLQPNSQFLFFYF